MRFEAKSIDPSLMPFSDSEIISDYLIIPVVDYGAREDHSFLVALGKLVETFFRSKSIRGNSIADDVEKMVCEHIGLNWDEHCDWVQRALDEAERSRAMPQSVILRDGPRYWTELHLFSFRNRNCEDRAFIESWFNNWVESIPWNGCPCKDHFEDYCKHFPPDFCRLWEWGIGIHNDVNKRNGKKQLSLNEAEQLWTKRLL
jgi:hypothetical protein